MAIKNKSLPFVVCHTGVIANKVCGATPSSFITLSLSTFTLSLFLTIFIIYDIEEYKKLFILIQNIILKFEMIHQIGNYDKTKEL